MTQINYCGSPHLCTLKKCKNTGCILDNPKSKTHPDKGTIETLIKNFWDRMEELEIGPFKPGEAKDIPVLAVHVEKPKFEFTGISLHQGESSKRKKQRFARFMTEDGLIPCHYCKTLFTMNEITRDHKVPVSVLRRGPRMTIEDYTTNIVPACYSCNQKKGNMDYDEFMKLINPYDR